MWHIGRERNGTERNFLVGAFDAEFTIGEFNVCITRFHEVGCNFLGLGFNFVEGTHERGTADRNRT